MNFVNGELENILQPSMANLGDCEGWRVRRVCGGEYEAH